MSVLQFLSKETEFLPHLGEDEVVWEDEAFDDAILTKFHSDRSSFRMNPVALCLDKLAHTRSISGKECKLVLIFKVLHFNGWLKKLIAIFICMVLKINVAGLLEWQLVIQEAQTHQLTVE